MFKKGHAKIGGRKSGTPNKASGEAKTAIALAADRLGGVDRLVEWAKSDPANERVFWSTIYPKLIPVTLNGDPDYPVRAGIEVSFVSRPT
jgi:hypothetical protein